MINEYRYKIQPSKHSVSVKAMNTASAFKKALSKLTKHEKESCDRLKLTHINGISTP